MAIKHISFDLWMTLIRSNPDFRRKRAEFIAEKFHLKNKNIDNIIQLIVAEDKKFDHYNETKNTKIPAICMYTAILKEMEISSSNALADDAEYLLNMSNELFLEYPPTLLNSRIPEILATLQDSGLTLSIGSNTGFVEGNVLRILLQKMNILQHFSFLVFSDEIKISKPAAEFYRHIWKNTLLDKSQILHVGDNPAIDYQGAVDFGFNALLLTDINYSLNDIKAKL
ncbi:MAG: HAD family hydrolase [Bacteroidales bacterium]|jgi:putative hydrolase of the HAD superfamily|nr:HAD family hydrolase [Bacteroidales bacterium]